MEALINSNLLNTLNIKTYRYTASPNKGSAIPLTSVNPDINPNSALILAVYNMSGSKWDGVLVPYVFHSSVYWIKAINSASYDEIVHSPVDTELQIDLIVYYIDL